MPSCILHLYHDGMYDKQVSLYHNDSKFVLLYLGYKNKQWDSNQELGPATTKRCLMYK